MSAHVPTVSQDFWRRIDASSYTFFERVTSPPAYAMLSQSGLFTTSDTSPLVILDNACGTGVITRLLYEAEELKSKQLNVFCGDLSLNMVESVRKRITEQGWKGARAEVIDAQDSKLPSNHFTHVFTNFAIMLMPEPQAALKECFRVLQPGGSMAFTGWSYRGWIEPVRSAFGRITGAPPFPDTYGSMLPQTGKWDDPSFVREQLASVGCENVEVEVLDFEAPMESAKAFAKGITVLLSECTQAWSQEEKEKYKPLIVPEVERVLAEAHGDDKPFGLRMVAIIATGIKPARLD